MIRPARMSDVAKLAGVGTMTVSRAINGNVRVTDETRKRVFDAIATLNYRPNEIARSLREQRSKQIGMIVPNLYDPFFAICAHEANLVANEHGYSINIATSDEDPEREYTVASQMLRRHIDGLIVIPSAGLPSHLTKPEFQETPIVTLDRPISKSSFDSVVVQNGNGARLAVQHLIEHQHRRISCLNLSVSRYTMKARNEGYRQAMIEAGLKPDSHTNIASQEEMLSTLRMLIALKNRPTAIFCTNNLTSRYALHALSELQINVPETIALIGFDDFETADILNPPVTVVRQPIVELARCGAQLLFSRLAANGRSEPIKRIVLPVELIIRDSCGGNHRVDLLPRTPARSQ